MLLFTIRSEVFWRLIFSIFLLISLFPLSGVFGESCVSSGSAKTLAQGKFVSSLSKELCSIPGGMKSLANSRYPKMLALIKGMLSCGALT